MEEKLKLSLRANMGKPDCLGEETTPKNGNQIKNKLNKQNNNLGSPFFFSIQFFIRVILIYVFSLSLVNIFLKE